MQKLLPKDPVTVIDEFVRCLLTLARFHSLGRGGKWRTKKIFCVCVCVLVWIGVVGMTGRCTATAFFQQADLA